MAERMWMIVAAVLLLVAAILLWRNNWSAAFVSATFGAVAWFLSYRSQLRAQSEVDKTHDSRDQNSDEN